MQQPERKTAPYWKIVIIKKANNGPKKYQPIVCFDVPMIYPTKIGSFSSDRQTTRRCIDRFLNCLYFICAVLRWHQVQGPNAKECWDGSLERSRWMPSLDCLDGAPCGLGRGKPIATTLVLDGVLSCAAHGFSATLVLRAFPWRMTTWCSKSITRKYLQHTAKSKVCGPENYREIGSMLGKYGIVFDQQTCHC